MLDSVTKTRINTARDILVGKVPDPKSQVEQITIALIYKFMDDMDVEAEELGGKRTFFAGKFSKYAWRKIFDPSLSGIDLLNMYSEAITTMDTNPGVPKLFRDIFKNAYLPYRDPETLKSFLKIINEFEYTHSEKLGDAFEFLLSILGSQGDAGQFRTPRHIIDFMVGIIDPKKHEIILDPACGTAGFLISSYKHIIKQNSSNYLPEKDRGIVMDGNQSVNEVIPTTNGYTGDKLSANERSNLADNMHGYDISPDMVRLSLVNMYLHGVKEPQIFEYDSLTSEDHWNEYSDVILANPPFMSPKGGIRPHKRFSVQSNRSEVLFVDYIAEHLTSEGRAAVIVPEGIIFQSGNAYKQLRKMLVEKYLVGIISLPAGVFNPYSGVKTSILWLDKSLAKKTDKILFGKIENDGFDLGAQRRAIKGNDLPNVLQIIESYKTDISKGTPSNTSLSNSLIIEKSDIARDGNYALSGERYRKSTIIKQTKFPLCKIGDLSELINGRAFKPSDWESKSKGGMPIIRIQNLNDPKAEYNYYSNDVTNRYNVNTGDLLFSWSGSRGTSFGAHIWNGSRAILNQHIFNVKFDSERVLKKYFYYALNKAVEEVEQNLHGGVGLVHITKGNLENIEIPIPPLPIQEEIVSELDCYQKIIDGARQVVENYKPRIDIDPAWEMVELGDIIKLTSGRFLSNQNMILGEYPVYGGNGVNGYHNEYFLEEPTIVIGRVGAYCGSTLITQPKAWVTDNGLYVKEYLRDVEIDFMAQMLRQLNINQYAKVGGQPSISQSTVLELKVPYPDLPMQKKLVDKLKTVDSLINSSRELILIYEQMIKDRIAKVWGE